MKRAWFIGFSVTVVLLCVLSPANATTSYSIPCLGITYDDPTLNTVNGHSVYSIDFTNVSNSQLAFTATIRQYDQSGSQVANPLQVDPLKTITSTFDLGELQPGQYYSPLLSLDYSIKCSDPNLFIFNSYQLFLNQFQIPYPTPTPTPTQNTSDFINQLLSQPVPPATLSGLADPDKAWIYGQDIFGYDCLDLKSAKVSTYLQVFSSGNWITVAKGSVSKNQRYCPSIYMTTYHWKLNVRGVLNPSAPPSELISFREYIPRSNFNPKPFYTSPTKKEMFPSRLAQIETYLGLIPGSTGSLTP